MSRVRVGLTPKPLHRGSSLDSSNRKLFDPPKRWKNRDEVHRYFIEPTISWMEKKSKNRDVNFQRPPWMNHLQLFSALVCVLETQVPWSNHLIDLPWVMRPSFHQGMMGHPDGQPHQDYVRWGVESPVLVERNIKGCYWREIERMDPEKVKNHRCPSMNAVTSQTFDHDPC